MNELNNNLPSSFNLIRGSYVGGPNLCVNTNSCANIK